MTDAASTGGGAALSACPSCGQPVTATDQFCESCGAALTDAAARPATAAPAFTSTTLTPPPQSLAASQPESEPAASDAPATCTCGGEIDADGYCKECGMRAPSERDHFSEQPAAHVAAVCDKGVVHVRNEDATAVAVTGARIVLVVCDGVTSATDSDVASLAAARAARDLLVTVPDPPTGSPAVVVEHWTSQLSAATAAAQRAAVDTTRDAAVSDTPASTTFVAAVVDGAVLVAAWVGDSRCYWLPETGAALQVSVDDSWASDQIAQGMARDVAERDSRAHAITRWLGVDSPGGEPSSASVVVDGAGWVLVCSDGLWNYCSPADELRSLLADQVAAVGPDPLAVASALCDWANREGGHDNITVALARMGGPPVTAEGPGAAASDDTPEPDRADRDAGPDEEQLMAEWTTEVFENEYLAADGTDVHAIVSITCTGAGTAGQTGAAAEVIIVDTSGSMSSPSSKISSARKAAAAAIDEIVDGTWFAVIAGDSGATLAYPMTIADDDTRRRAKEAVKRFDASGGTAIGSWLNAATALFAEVDASQRHAILLTDGRNESEHASVLRDAVESAQGVFQCDCRGVGDDWEVEELRQIASALLGSVDIIAEPERMADDFQEMMRTSMARGVADATLRVWTPQGAELQFVRQVAPTIEELTDRAVQADTLVREYPTGSWGDESRDYHVSVRVPPKPLGAEQLVARVQLVVGGEVVGQGLVKATWSDDATLTTRINAAVAHYTGQTELASAIQEGLAAKAAGDDATATVKLGRAAQLAAETGDDEATNKLKRVVDIEDPETGTVRLKAKVSKLDEMALDTSSTKTTRVR